MMNNFSESCSISHQSYQEPKLPTRANNVDEVKIPYNLLEKALLAFIITIAFTIGATFFIIFLIGTLSNLHGKLLEEQRFLRRFQEEVKESRRNPLSKWFEEKDKKCDDGWRYQQSGGMEFCYKAWYRAGVTKNEAAQFCKSNHSSLISIRSAEEDHFVYAVAYNVSNIHRIWIGLENIPNGRTWTDQTIDKYGTAYYNLRQQYKVQPFLFYMDKPWTAKCIRCKPIELNGWWYLLGTTEMTEPDQRPDGFVCKKRVKRQKIFPPLTANTCKSGWIYYNYTNACYYLQNFTDPKLLNSKLFSWREAEINCRGFGAHLTSIHSINEREFVKDLATSDLRGPLGLSEGDDGCADDHYVWIGLQIVNNTRIYTDGTIDDFFTFVSRPAPNQFYKLCNDVINTYVESVLSDTNDRKLSRFICKMKPEKPNE